MHGLDIHHPCISWTIASLAVGYAAYVTYKLASCKGNDKVNKEVDLSNSKVVHSYDIEDLDKKAVFCRCWKSKKFPYCDGSHNKHNETTGDNVGPLIIQKKDE